MCKEPKVDYKTVMTLQNNENINLNVEHFRVIKIRGSYTHSRYCQKAIVFHALLEFGLFDKDDTHGHETFSTTTKGSVYGPKPREASWISSWVREPLVISTTLGTFGMGIHLDNVHFSCIAHEALWFIHLQHPFACVHQFNTTTCHDHNGY